MKNYHILMADIIDSSQKDARILMRDFKTIAARLNKQYKKAFYSPITITLGDEFQCVVRSLKAGLDIIFAFEEEIIHSGASFKLRYVLNFGEIDTPINSENAYGMMGNGLTEAREMLEELKKSEGRFTVNAGGAREKEIINLAFKLYQSEIDDWKTKDYYLIREFLKLTDYKKVAKKLGKDSSLMWRRSKSLGIENYLEAKNLLTLLSDTYCV